MHFWVDGILEFVNAKKSNVSTIAIDVWLARREVYTRAMWLWQIALDRPSRSVKRKIKQSDFVQEIQLKSNGNTHPMHYKTAIPQSRCKWSNWIHAASSKSSLKSESKKKVNEISLTSMHCKSWTYKCERQNGDWKPEFQCDRILMTEIAWIPNGAAKCDKQHCGNVLVHERLKCRQVFLWNSCTETVRYANLIENCDWRESLQQTISNDGSAQLREEIKNTHLFEWSEKSVKQMITMESQEMHNDSPAPKSIWKWSRPK